MTNQSLPEEFVEIALAMFKESTPLKMECSAPRPGEVPQVCLVINGVILSPRQTWQHIKDRYEAVVGRKVSKKEINFLMHLFRKELTKPIEKPEEEVVKTVDGKTIVLSGPAVALADDSIFRSK